MALLLTIVAAMALWYIYGDTVRLTGAQLVPETIKVILGALILLVILAGRKGKYLRPKRRRTRINRFTRKPKPK